MLLSKIGPLLAQFVLFYDINGTYIINIHIGCNIIYFEFIIVTLEHVFNCFYLKLVLY